LAPHLTVVIDVQSHAYRSDENARYDFVYDAEP
jgi:hypothetical protein